MKIGEKIPEIKMLDQNKEEFTIEKFQGKKILLSFHPLAWTGVCTEQMKSLEKNQKRFKELNVEAVGVSVDTVPSKAAWAKELKIEYTKLLADFWPHGENARKLGLFIEDKGVSKRANILIDENGTIIWMKEYEISQLPDIEEVFAALKE